MLSVFLYFSPLYFLRRVLHCTSNLLFPQTSKPRDPPLSPTPALGYRQIMLHPDFFFTWGPWLQTHFSCLYVYSPSRLPKANTAGLKLTRFHTSHPVFVVCK